MIQFKKAEIDLARREHQTFNDAKGPVPLLNDSMVRMIIHDHNAKRAGPHKDMRIAMGGKAYSWATRHGFPTTPGEPRMWYRQPEHTITYMDFQGENKGYGAGTTKLDWDSQVKVTSKDGRINLDIPSGQHQGQYAMMHQGGDNWLVVKKRPNEKTADHASPTTPDFWRQYAKHTALNLGQAARDARYFYSHPEADSMAGSLIKRLPSLVNNLVFSVLPPHLHHSPEELKQIDEHTLKEWFLLGYKPWQHGPQIEPNRNLPVADQDPTLDSGPVKGAEDRGETLSVILKIKRHTKFLKSLQKQVSKLVKGLRDFEVDFHVTLAYASGLTDEGIKKALPAVKKIITGKKFKFKVGPLTDLTNQDKEGVIYLKAGSKDLTDTHWKLRAAIQKQGGKFSFPTFKAHVTLAYRDNPLTDADRKKLRSVDALFEVSPTSSDIDVTRKTSAGWEKLAEQWGTFDKFATDNKWDQVLIESPHGNLTKKDIADYYRTSKVRSGLMMDLLKSTGSKLQPGMTLIRQTFEPGETVLRRKNDKGSYIQIRSHYGDTEDPTDLHYYVQRRATEFHPVIEGSDTRRVWVDIDPHKGVSWDRVKEVAGNVHRRLGAMPGVRDTEVRFSGGTGFYVIGNLDKAKDVDQARKSVQEAMRPLTGDKDVTLGIAGAGQIRLDTTTLKRMGSIRGLYSLNAETGLASVPVKDLKSFQLTDATIKKVTGK